MIQRPVPVLHKWIEIYTCCIVCLLFACKAPVPADNTLAVFKTTADSVFANRLTGNERPVAYLIVPNTGCGGCISSAEKVLSDFIRKKYPVRFILTNINSLKVLKQNLGDSIVLNENVYPDVTNLFYSKLPALTEIYPIAFYIDKDGNPAKFEYVKPENPLAIEDLAKYVAASVK